MPISLRRLHWCGGIEMMSMAREYRQRNYSVSSLYSFVLGVAHENGSLSDLLYRRWVSARCEHFISSRNLATVLARSIAVLQPNKHGGIAAISGHFPCARFINLTILLGCLECS